MYDYSEGCRILESASAYVLGCYYDTGQIEYLCAQAIFDRVWTELNVG